MAGIIQAYGLFWSEENVHWGRGRQRGTLLGVPAGARTSDPIDFRDQVGIYILYEGHQMIYVGQTGAGAQRLFKRLKKHRNDSLVKRWDHFSWFGLRRVNQSGNLSTENLRASASIAVTLNHIEAVLIAAAEPILNNQGGRFGKHAKRYLQKRDDHLGPTHEEMITELWKLRSEN